MKTVPKPLVLVNQWTIVLSVIVALLTGNVYILFIPLVCGILNLAVHFHPIMRFAKLFLRKPMAEYVQEDADQQRFNQWIAVICLTAAVVSYSLSWMISFYVFTALVGLAAFVAILGFCVGCFIRFQYNQWKYRRKQAMQS